MGSVCMCMCVYVLLGMAFMDLSVPGKCSITEPHYSPRRTFFIPELLNVVICIKKRE